MNRSFFLVANAAASLLLPYILESLINRAEDEAESASQHTRAVNKSIITQGLLQLVALALLESICQFLYTLLFRIAGAKLVQRVREKVYHSLLSKSTEFYQREAPAELVAKMAEVELIEHLVLHCSELARNILFVVGILSHHMSHHIWLSNQD
jgi:ABC-type multidrug transport system fused ATPase/permease subunit